MLKYKIIMSKEANRDVERISEYLENYKQVQERTIIRINEDIFNLEFMPRIHKTLYSYKDKNGEYRRIVSGKYIIIYKIFKNQIIIMRIFSQKQNYLNSKNFILREKNHQYNVKS